MTAELLIHAGDPKGALEALQEQVKKNPTDPKLRIFLFQLLAVNGQWKRAQTQLELAGQLDPEADPMVQAYRDVLSPLINRSASSRSACRNNQSCQPSIKSPLT